MTRHNRRTHVDLRRRLYEVLEHGAIGDRAGLIVGRLIVVLIVINLLAMTLDTVPKLQAEYGPLFTAIELLSLVLFTIEYGLRVWVAAEHAPHRHSSERKARWEFITSPLGVIDLLAVLAFLGCVGIAIRFAGPVGVSNGALSQVGALLAGDALAVGRAL